MQRVLPFFRRNPLFAYRTILLLLCAGLRTILAFCTHAIFWPDSASYVAEARAFLSNPSDFAHEIFHTPLYPIFLGGVLSTFGSNAPKILILLQHLLGLCSVIFVFESTRRIFSPRTAFLSALLFGVSPLLLYYECVVQTEVLFIFFLWLLILETVLLLETPGDWTRTLCVGLLCALTTLTRPVAQLLPALFVAALFFTSAPRLSRFRNASLLLASFLLAVLPWMFVNERSNGFFGIAKGGGLNLYLREFDLNEAAPLLPSSEPQVAEQYRVFHRTNNFEYIRIFRNLQMEYSAQKADNMMFHFAKETILESPASLFDFAFQVGVGIFSLTLAPNDSVGLCEENGIQTFCTTRPSKIPRVFSRLLTEPLPAPPIFGELLSRYVQIQGFNSFLLLSLGFLLLPALIWQARNAKHLSRDQKLGRIMLALIFCYFAAVSEVFNKPEDRYRLPIDPILFLSSVSVLGQLFFRLLQKERESGERPGRATISSLGHLYRTAASGKYESRKAPDLFPEYSAPQLDTRSALHH